MPELELLEALEDELAVELEDVVLVELEEALELEDVVLVELEEALELEVLDEDEVLEDPVSVEFEPEPPPPHATRRNSDILIITQFKLHITFSWPSSHLQERDINNRTPH